MFYEMEQFPGYRDGSITNLLIQEHDEIQPQNISIRSKQERIRDQLIYLHKKCDS